MARSFVVEKIPASLGALVARTVNIPVIGIGAGQHVDGQVLVTHDLLGITNEFQPRFLRKYANLHQIISDSVTHYVKDVKAKEFPNEKEGY